MKDLMNKIWLTLWTLVAYQSINTAFAIDLTPIDGSKFGYKEAKHLASRAGFGGTPKELTVLANFFSGSKKKCKKAYFFYFG